MLLSEGALCGLYSLMQDQEHVPGFEIPCVLGISLILVTQMMLATSDPRHKFRTRDLMEIDVLFNVGQGVSS